MSVIAEESAKSRGSRKVFEWHIANLQGEISDLLSPEINEQNERLKNSTMNIQQADIQQAFLQISVNECHRNYLRFLWYNNIFNENSLKVYRFARVLFGLTCSPFLLNGTVKVHVEKHVNHDTRAVLEKFLRDSYVDDTATSFNSIGDASKIHSITSSVMSKGGFNLRKWDSNDEMVKRLICNDSSKFMKGNEIGKV